MNSEQKKERARTRILLLLPLVFVVLGWVLVIAQSMRLEQAAINTFQEAEKEVVNNAARAATVYIENEIARRGVRAVPDIEQEVLDFFVKPVRIGELGDAWIYSPDYAVYDESEDFPREYIGKSMAEIFEIQQQYGAWHYEEMTRAVSNAEPGVGWYVWDPNKAAESAPSWDFITRDTGREIAAWTPVVVFPGTEQELTWIIGMSVMLPEIMQETGTYDQIETMVLAMLVMTGLVLALLFLLTRAESQVQELRQQVEELHIQVDEAKRKREVSSIVESDYFRDLSSRATSLREQRKARVNNADH